MIFTPQPQPGDGLFPRFYLVAEEDRPASLEAGRPIFREVEMVEIHRAGDRLTTVVARVNDDHRGRWPQLYTAFSEGRTQAVEGTPLEQWPSLGVSRVAELKALNIHTVEHLAEISDTALQNLMGGNSLRAQARAYIDAARGNAPHQALAVENEALKQEIERLKRQFNELGEAKKK
jgi:hypothetical protein